MQVGASMYMETKEGNSALTSLVVSTEKGLGIKMYFCHANHLPRQLSWDLGERQTEEPGSNPENSSEFCIIPGFDTFLLFLLLSVAFLLK